MTVINQNRRKGRAKSVLAFEQVRKSFSIRQRVDLQKPCEALFFEEAGIECKRGCEASDRITRAAWGPPRFQHRRLDLLSCLAHRRS